jgi:hypothetical protein
MSKHKSPPTRRWDGGLFRGLCFTLDAKIGKAEHLPVSRLSTLPPVFSGRAHHDSVLHYLRAIGIACIRPTGGEQCCSVLHRRRRNVDLGYPVRTGVRYFKPLPSD